MSRAIEALNGWADAWARTVWDVTWQSALVVVLFALAAYGLRRASPSVRYWLWQVAAIKLLLIPLWTFAITVPSDPRRSGDGPAARPSQAARHDASAQSLRILTGSDPGGSTSGLADPPRVRAGLLGAMPLGWRAWLLLGWGAAIAVQVVVIARQGSRLARLLAVARTSDDPRLSAVIEELSGRIGLTRPPEIRISDRDGSPFVCGLARPKLVLPPGLAHALDPEALRSVLLHELAHIKRGDLLWDWIPTSVRVLYFFNPLAHFLFDRIRLERELACDRAAMLLAGQGAAGYAATLVDVVGRSSAPPYLRAALASAGLDGNVPGIPTELTPPMIPGKE